METEDEAICLHLPEDSLASFESGTLNGCRAIQIT